MNTKSLSNPQKQVLNMSDKNPEVYQGPNNSEDNSIFGSKGSKGHKLNTQFSFSGIATLE